MFKKRAPPSKKTDINAEVSSIESTLPQTDNTQQSRPKFQTTIDTNTETGSQSQRIQSGSTYQILETLDDTNPFLNYIPHQSDDTESYASKYQPVKPKGMMEEIIEISEGESPPPSQPPIKSSTSPQRRQTVVIEDDEGEYLEIEEDIHGGLDVDFAYEDEIIKKALTRQNYARLKINSSEENTAESKEKKLLKKISLEGISKSIEAQISKGQSRIRDIQQKVSYHQDVINRNKLHMSPKQMQHQQSKDKLEKIKRILRLIYHRGSEIQQFTLEGLNRQIEQEEENQQCF